MSTPKSTQPASAPPAASSSGSATGAWDRAISAAETRVRNRQSKKPKGRQGFASMDPELRRQICSKGGKTAHAKGTAHEFSSDEARAAGKKGGLSVSRNREHMAMIGRRGGERRGRGGQSRTDVATTSGAAA